MQQLETETGTTKAQVFIDVRGLRYMAERLTKTNYIALGSLVREKGKPMPDLTQTGTKEALAEQMLEKFADPDYMKRLCYSLLSIFPTLGMNGLVWFEPNGGNTVPSWGSILEPEEILNIITVAAQALQSQAASESEWGLTTKDTLGNSVPHPLPPGYTVDDINKSAQTVKDEEANRVRAARIAELEAELARVRSLG